MWHRRDGERNAEDMEKWRNAERGIATSNTGMVKIISVSKGYYICDAALLLKKILVWLFQKNTAVK